MAISSVCLIAAPKCSRFAVLQAFQQQAGVSQTAEQPATQHMQPDTAAAPHSGGVQVVPQLWAALAEKYGDRPAVHDPHQQPETKLTYRYNTMVSAWHSESISPAGGVLVAMATRCRGIGST